LTHSVVLFLHSHCPLHFDCIARHIHIFSLCLWLPWRLNQSGNIWRGDHIPPFCVFRILDAIVLLYIRFIICRAIVALSFGLSLSPFQLSQSSVSEMLSGVLSSSLSTGWQLILQIWRTFKIWVHPPGRSFADKGGGGKGDLSDNMNAATPWCWKSDLDTLTISFVSEIYPMVVICLFWQRNSFWVARSFWLPCHISKTSWTFAILCIVIFSTSFFMSELFSVIVVSNSGSPPTKFWWLGPENCLTTTISWRVWPVVLDCL